MPRSDHVVLTECLDERFPGGRESFVTLFSNSDGPFKVKKITNPQDGKDFADARFNNGYGLRFPATIVYASLLYNGQKVTASKDENADLYWAVRGKSH